MYPYLLVAVAATAAAAVGSARGLRALWWVLPSVILIALAAGRSDDVGTDTSMYHGFFLGVDPTSLGDSLADIPQEMGYVTLMFVVRQWTENYRIFLIVCAALTVMPVLFAIRRASRTPVLSVFLYIALSYYLFSFNGIRQGIAVSLVLLAETYRDDNRTAWLLLYGLAATFHVSAFFAFVAILVARSQAARPLRLLIAAGLLSVLGALLFSIPALGGFLNSFNDRYEEYLSSELGAGTGTILVLIVHLAIAVVLIVIARHAGSPLSDYIAIYILSYAALILALTNRVAGRIEPYFGIFGILAIPNALADSNHRHARGVVAVMILVAAGHFVLHTWFYNGLVPYESTWNE